MLGWIIGIGVPLIYLLGFVTAVDALMHSKQAQSATAWILGLVLIPFITLPIYWIFGRRKFSGYIEVLEEFNNKTVELRRNLDKTIRDNCGCNFDNVDKRTLTEIKTFECLADGSFTNGNRAELLVNGDEMFPAMFETFDSAEQYILVQFYIIHADDIGTEFKQRLLAARARGVAVYLLYDEIGSMKLPDEYIDELKSAGAEVSAFSGGRSAMGRFRLNFRNHRKIVVVDGRVAMVGGLNVGDEYLGRDKKVGFWRDTHMRMSGPVALDVQLSFTRDWHYATKTVLEHIRWEPDCHDTATKMLIAGSGPHDVIKNCGLLFAHLIASAEKRVWIASPYLVPDGRVIGALQLAAMGGVDVRIMVPRRSDTMLFRYVPFAFTSDILESGGRVFFYENDFMHQKVILVDDSYGVVSTANLDNRSFFLNFEISCVVMDPVFCNEIQSMLESDFNESTEISMQEVKRRTFLERLGTQATRLFAPLL